MPLTLAQRKYYQVRKMHNGDHFRKAVMASACQPVFMTPVKVNKNVPGEKNPDHQFVDGGVREYAGVEMAIQCRGKGNIHHFAFSQKCTGQ